MRSSRAVATSPGARSARPRGRGVHARGGATAVGYRKVQLFPDVCSSWREGGAEVTKRPKRFDDAPDVSAAIQKLGHQRGPGPDEGRNACDPWQGIVEETPAIWVTWLVDAAKRAGYALPLTLEVAGQKVPLVSVALTYGLRWYFKCPRCGRRCEALYVRRQDFGCRRCLRLGYRSQKARPTSCYAMLDRVFARDYWAGRWDGDASKASLLADEVRRRLEAQVDRLFADAKVEATKG